MCCLFICLFIFSLFIYLPRMKTIKVRRGLFFFSLIVLPHFLTYIISLSAAYLAQVYVQMVEYAIKKHSLKLFIFLEKGPKVCFGKE